MEIVTENIVRTFGMCLKSSHFMYTRIKQQWNQLPPDILRTVGAVNTKVGNTGKPLQWLFMLFLR